MKDPRRFLSPSYRPARAAGLAALLIALSPAAHAAVTETTLHAFSGADGTPGSPPLSSFLIAPTPSLVRANDGNYYGVSQGGTSAKGAVFRLTPAGVFTIIYSFIGSDGANPVSLTLGSDGNLYGATFQGGAANGGTVFRITTAGTLTTLHSFTGGSDGFNPAGRLIQASDGNFYGATQVGGIQAVDHCPIDAISTIGCGVVYRLTTSGTESVILSFGNAFGVNGVVQGSDGKLYGTAQNFWDTPSDPFSINGNGLVFRLDLAGTGYTELHRFAGSADGSSPRGDLLQGVDGNFYGTTYYGGASDKGTIYQITPTGTTTIRHAFTGTDGTHPVGALIQGPVTHAFFGVTESGGASNVGTVFKLSQSGTFTSKYSFTGGTDGSTPNGSLTQLASDTRYFFGTTLAGGSAGSGTAYKLKIPLF